jgi:ubiquinone/menaquinone biosynthesis C-methylase UbiE
MSDATYVLGHAERELSRLQNQARLLAPITRKFFIEAGITTGMRVLDVGSGAGDVAFLVAEIVGPSGAVIGTDKAASAVNAATQNVRNKGLPHVSFTEGDPAQMSFDQPFDAVVGRYVLLFQAEPEVTVRKLARHVRPGGLLAFHEPDWVSARSAPPAPTYDRCCAWINDAFLHSGIDTNMASRLYATFVRAGLVAPQMRMQTFIATLERLSIATAKEVGAATLAKRLQHEISAKNSAIVGRSEVAIWART